MTHFPMTTDQRQAMDRDLATLKESIENIATVLGACYGEEDSRVGRAEEVRGAVQRLLWALERQAQTATAGRIA